MVEACNKEIAKQQELNKALEATIVTLIGDNNKFDKYLMKVFKKKIKRRRKSEQGREEGRYIACLHFNMFCYYYFTSGFHNIIYIIIIIIQHLYSAIVSYAGCRGACGAS